MNIDKYRTKNGDFVDQDGCYYEDVEDFIATGLLGFCGCGKPHHAIKHVRQSLQLVHDLKYLVWEEKLTYKEWKEKTKEVFLNEGAEYFMWYFLDNKELTEHGGSVPGWLTGKGEELLADLNEFLNKNDKLETTR